MEEGVGVHVWIRASELLGVTFGMMCSNCSRNGIAL